ncbi:MAG: pyridoxal-phosphate dependent enzyme, partial [Clostridia bacterium]|nr:pyridoxal-phosphate dependent enzyme [Clostridia bacterium]
MNKIPFGPTYEEMLERDRIDPKIKARALKAREDELDSMNLFNITWKDEENNVMKVVLPGELTGIDANIVVMLGKYFPSGSHKVGPAYSTLIEGCVDGTILPGEHTILGPSTGNFGIGVSYICNLMGYDSIVIMPDNMSKERYDRIKRYGAKLDLTPGTESDVILTLQRTYELMKEPKNRSLAQFELLPNYRFHRYVTGNSAIEAVKGIGNGRIACFACAPGSAGTIAAGDEIKNAFPEARVAALEPYECSTLTNGGRGQHRIEGIGDKMCTLIHNVLNTDFVVL